MKLYWSSRSPYVRKVMMAAHELGLAKSIRTERVIVSATSPNATVLARNPLGKIPTLELADGRALYDSRVIVEYLDTLHDGPRLFPREAGPRLEALRRQALGDGLMDILVPWLLESRKPAEKQDAEFIKTSRLKVTNTLDALEREAPALHAGAFTIGHVTIAVALGYLDFRFKELAWREPRPVLAVWHTAAAARPSYVATEFQDVY